MEAHQAMKLQETHARGTIFVGAASIWKAFPANLKPPAPSCVNEPCKLNPCPSVCYLHVLTKAQGKGTWAFPKKLAKALDNYLAKEGCLEDPFSKQILRNYQPCVSTPKTPEQHKECVKQKRLSITNLAQICFILQLWRNIPLTTMTSIELRLLNTCCITQKVRC